MPSFLITSDGKKFKVTAPDQATAIAAFKSMTEQTAVAPERDPYEGLAIPGTTPTQGYLNEVPQSRRFGLSQSDTLNPLPALNTFANETMASIPVAGPTLQNIGENADAFLENNVYGPLAGRETAIAPEGIAAENVANALSNPEAATAGQIAGPVATYLALSRIPGGAQALGLNGPWAQRVVASLLSNQAINTADNMAHGEAAGEAFGNAILPSALAAPFALLGKSPAAINKVRDEAVAMMKAEGVPLTGGQASGSRSLKYVESELGGGATERLIEDQGEAFTQAALKRAGIDANRATPEVIDNAFETLGNHFDRLAALTDVPFDARLQNEMLAAATKYEETTGIPAKAVENLLNRTAELAAKNNGVLSGEAYQNLRSAMGKLTSSADGPTKIALGEFRDALDDAVEHNISPKLLQAWQITRRRYKNLLAITDAASRAGEAATGGIITPANLRSAAANQGKRAYARGKGDLNELSRAGVQTMTPLPQSGTAPRMAARAAFTTPSTIMGAMAGHDMGGLPGLLIGGAASTALPFAVGRALLSPAGRAIAGGQTPLNKALQSPVPNLVARALAGSLMSP